MDDKAMVYGSEDQIQRNLRIKAGQKLAAFDSGFDKPFRLVPLGEEIGGMKCPHHLRIRFAAGYDGQHGAPERLGEQVRHRF